MTAPRVLNYYGSKSSVVKYYPHPKHEKIIEPFAGSASYALLHRRHAVHLNELHPKIAATWRWLIHEATPVDILMLPRLSQGARVSQVSGLRDEARTLLSCWGNQASGGTGNHDVVTMFGTTTVRSFRLRLARLLPEIKHWTVTQGDYRNVPNEEVTWFIDPPYNNASGQRNDVHISDADESLIGLWRYLQSARPGDILMLPRMSAGQRLALDLSVPERYLLALYAAPSRVPTPRLRIGSRTKVTSWSRGRIRSFRARTAKLLPRIKHWTITCDDYRNVLNEKATWFIDPPYSGTYRGYENSRVDYRDLAEWCRSRHGQVIVCDAGEANWLPFRVLCTVKGFGNKTRIEKIWTSP